ncbi:recombinase family protein [Hamadaea sp. NPDC050747]|uniref:recombinase family protein n=1 Tax=Hamadaea sp. NPDC050747 TaxID=3155789 RepID=UPI003405FFF7
MTPPVWVTGTAIHVGGYVRQSAARENKSEASPATQRAANRAKAEHYPGAVWVDSYEDIGISGFSGVERPEFERLLNDCRAGRVNMIIVYYISRLSRLDPLDAIPIVTELLNLGVTIVSVTEGEFRRGNLMDLIHLIMRLDAAHSESKNKSVAIRGAKDVARQLGGFVGGKAPYGFSLGQEMRANADGKLIAVNVLVENPDEAKVIRHVKDQIDRHGHEHYQPNKHRRHPGSLSGICKMLNDDGTPTRGNTVGKETADSSWHPKTLIRILRDPRIAGYAAEVVYKPRADGRKSKVIDRYRITHDPETGEPLRPWPAIIDPGEWHALQLWLDGRGRGHGLSRGASLLGSVGVAYCECGKPMKANNAPQRRVNAAYACTLDRRRRQPGDHPGTCAVSQRGLDDLVVRRIFAVIATAEDDEDSLAIVAEATRMFGLAAQDPAMIGERNRLVAERADAAQALELLYDDRKAGGYSGDLGRKRFLAEEAALGGRLAEIEERIASLEASITPTLPIGEWLGEPGSDPLGPGSWWAGAPLAERRQFVKLFVRRITVRKSAHKGQAGRVEERVTVEFAQPASAPEE